MRGKDLLQAIFQGEHAPRVGFWLGNPADETKVLYQNHLGIQQKSERLAQEKLPPLQPYENDLELHLKFQSDLYWCTPEFIPACYAHPLGKPLFDVYGGKPKISLNQPGVFANCESVKEIDQFKWPNPNYFDFSPALEIIEQAASHGLSIFSGMWAPFFHILCDFFGMDNYFVKMYTNPEVIEAATEHIINFYLEANKRFFDIAASKIDVFFLGNDFGSQLNLLISPQTFTRFVLPGIKKLVDQAKSYDLFVAFHSCGAISQIIPQFIDIGIDALHPLQAKAEGMNAEKLAKQFKGEIVFIGGVDTQNLLPFKSAQEVKAEVYWLKKIFGERFIVSPSHEALLPHVSIENALAMRDAALE